MVSWPWDSDRWPAVKGLLHDRLTRRLPFGFLACTLVVIPGYAAVRVDSLSEMPHKEICTLTHRSLVLLAVSLICVLAPFPARAADRVTERLKAERRQAVGFWDVLAAHSLNEARASGRLTPAEYIDRIWSDYPEIAMAVYERWGDFDSACFRLDLVFGQTNGVIGSDAGGKPIFFDPAACLDSAGSVVPDLQDEYIAILRANEILQRCYQEWKSDPVYGVEPIMNNKCCTNSYSEKCVEETGKHCEMSHRGDTCTSGSTRCSPPLLEE